MKNNLFIAVIAVVAGLAAIWLVWEWGFCRFYVDAGQMAVITAKEGQDLPAGHILAEPGQKGIWKDPLAEGRHFLNPISYDWKIVPQITIPAGKVGIVTAKGGKDLASGEFLARAGEKGIWENVLGPGRYRLNPEGYNITLVDAINIPIGYVGVVTSLSGTKAQEGQFAAAGQKGIRCDILQPGLYYINSNAYKIDVLEIGVNQVSLTGRESQVLTKTKVAVQNAAMDQLASNVLAAQTERRKEYFEQDAAAEKKVRFSAAPAAAKPATAKKEKFRPGPPTDNAAPDNMSTFGLQQCVEFPSRDGFEIRLDMTVEFELAPNKIAEILMRYGDLPAVVDKIILPQIQSISRLKGSSYRAQDFILGEGREKFQDDLKDALSQVLAQKDIKVHNSLIRHVEVPEQILQPIRLAGMAIEQNLTNIARQNTARKQAELNTQETMIEQRRQQVLQETEKLVAETQAMQEKSVAEIRATTLLDVARIAQETAAVRASVTRTLGQADAQVITLVEGEKSRGYQLKVGAIGNPAAYNLLTFSEKLNSDLAVRIIHAGNGTLWTDLKNPAVEKLAGAKILAQPGE